MTHIIDTNILIRQTETQSSDRQVALHATSQLFAQGEELRSFTQNIIEFWAVATRPSSVNGLGLSILEAEAERQSYETLFPILPDPPGIYERWVELVNQYGVSGKTTHDARIVAATLEHGLTHILTFNIHDFQRYAPLGIVAVDPANVP